MDTLFSNIPLLIGGIFGVITLAILFFGSIVLPGEKNRAIVTFLGQYSKTLTAPGLKCPVLGAVATRIYMGVQNHEVNQSETITKDKVTVHPKIMVQYEVIPGMERESFYNIGNLGSFIDSVVVDVVRSTVPEMELDTCFHNKEQIGDAVKAALDAKLADHGYRVLAVLVPDIDFDANVKKEMNRINAAQRAQVAAQAEAQAELTKKVTAAEAEAKAMELHGKGIAAQREAIIKGLQDSVKAFQEAVPGATAAHAMEMVTLTQYMDMMRDVGANNAKIIMMPSSPSAVGDLRRQILEGMTIANATTEAGNPNDAA